MVYQSRKSTAGLYGPFNCYKIENEGIVSPLYSYLKPKYPEYIDFLLWYFQSSQWYPYIYKNGAQGGARHDRVGMINKLMEGIPIGLPCVEEQQKIANCLTVYDEVIQIKKEKLELWKNIKKGLLQQMFV